MKSEMFVEVFSRITGHGMILIDRSLQILMVNPKAGAMLGYESHELSSRRFDALLDPDSREELISYLESGFNRVNFHCSCPCVFLTGYGEKLPLEVEMVLWGRDNPLIFIHLTQMEKEGETEALGIQVDGSSNRIRVGHFKSEPSGPYDTMERILNELNSSPFGKAIVRCDDGKFVEANGHFTRLFGYDKESLIAWSGGGFRTIFDGDDLQSILDFHGSRYHFKKTCARKRNQEQIAVLLASELHTLYGRNLALLTVFEFTESADTEHTLFKLNLLLEKRVRENLTYSTEVLLKEKENNDIKNRFVTLASHEFKTPMSTILTSTYLLKQYLGTNELALQMKHVNKIESSVQTLNKLLNDFLLVEKMNQGIEGLNTTGFNLSQLIESSVAELNYRLKIGQKLTFSFHGTEYIVQDRVKIHNIVHNLLSNAIKYSHEQGMISIRCDSSHEMVRLDIEDQGMGIPEDEQKYLYSKFFRASNVSNIEGIGLGLNIVKSYLDMIGGSIDYKSKLNSGCKFSVCFPTYAKCQEISLEI